MTPGGDGKRHGACDESSLGLNLRGGYKNLKANPVLTSFLCKMRDEPQDLRLRKVKAQFSSLSSQMKRKYDVQLDFKLNGTKLNFAIFVLG